MTLPPTALVAFGAIAAAFIAGAVSFVNIIISKDQKTSEFRQKWIDDLRNELSQYLAMIDTVTLLFKEKSEIHYTRKMSEQELIDFYNSIHPELKEMNNLHNRIRLRLNPKKDVRLLTLLDKIEERFNNIDPKKGNEDFEYIESVVKTALIESQVLLKNEWLRVKRGEPSYIITKYSVLLAFILVIISFILVLLGIVDIDMNSFIEKT